jgi:hypothetical protein
MNYHTPAYAQKLPTQAGGSTEPPSEDTNPYGTFLGVVAPVVFPLERNLLGTQQPFVAIGQLVYL